MQMRTFVAVQCKHFCIGQASLAADIMSTYKKKQSSSSAIQNKFLHYKTTEIKSVVFCLVDIACSPNVGVVIT